MGRKVIRNSVFETNSSSCHSVSVRGKWDNDYKIDFYDNTILKVPLDEYGWNGYPCDDFISKLAYALSMVLHTEYPGFNHYDEKFYVDQNILETLDGYKLLLNAIREHSNNTCEKIVIERADNSFYPYGYIDHQSYEDYNSLQDFLDDWNVDVERFLYDYGVVVHISNDNG